MDQEDKRIKNFVRAVYVFIAYDLVLMIILVAERIIGEPIDILQRICLLLPLIPIVLYIAYTLASKHNRDNNGKT